MAIEHTAVRQLRGETFGPPLAKRIYVPLPITRQERATTSAQIAMGSKQLVNGLKPGDKVDSYFSVNYKKPVQEYKYGWMFELRGADKSGQITIKYWGGQDKASVEKLHDSFERDEIVRVRGEISEYRNQLEISVSEKNGGSLIKLAEGEYDIAELITTYTDIEEMKGRLHDLVRGVKEPNLRNLLGRFFEDKEFMDAFASCPASIQLHSAAVGGLLKHTLNVAEVCIRVTELHKELDADLVLTGALLHDIGKIPSFKVSSNISQTEQGRLIGHVILADQELLAKIKAIQGFPEQLGSKLRHMLLAHHGKREWGSPVEPMFPEALLVHEADDLDAKLDNMIVRREEAITEDDWIWDQRHNRLIYLK
jgi:3'-5' exoribonuclease